MSVMSRRALTRTSAGDNRLSLPAAEGEAGLVVQGLRFEYSQGPMLVWPPTVWRGTATVGPAEAGGSWTLTLVPDVIERGDVITMATGDEDYAEISSNTFVVHHTPSASQPATLSITTGAGRGSTIGGSASGGGKMWKYRQF